MDKDNDDGKIGATPVGKVSVIHQELEARFRLGRVRTPCLGLDLDGHKLGRRLPRLRVANLQQTVYAGFEPARRSEDEAHRVRTLADKRFALRTDHL